MKFRIWIILLVSALALTACSLAEDVTPPPNYTPPTAPPSPTPLATPTSFDLDAGKAIYETKCLACHGPTGMGDGPQAEALGVPVAALGDPAVAGQASLEDWFLVVTNGRLESMMPPFTSLTDRQRWDVVAYAMTLHQGGLAAAETPTPTAAPTEAAAETPASGTPTEAPSDTLTATPEAAAPTEPPTEAPTEAPPATADDTLTVVGSVIYGSGDVLPEDNLQAELRGYDPDDQGNFTLAYAEKTDVAPDGTFTFANVPNVQHRGFVVTVLYQDVEYTSEPQFLLPDQELLPFEVYVYDVTTSTEALTVSRAHFFFNVPAPGQMEVVEVYVISNNSTKTVVPVDETTPSLTFTLPENATNLRFDGGVLGGRFVKTENGFGDLQPIPGVAQQQIVFGYTLPYDGKLELSRDFTLNVDSIIALMPSGMTMESPYFTFQGEESFQGETFNSYQSQAIPAGGAVTINLDGDPESAGGQPTEAQDNNSLLIGMAGLGLALIGVGLWFYLRDREMTAEVEIEEFASSEEVMDAIIALDEQYQAGEIAEKAYRQRRAELKSLLQEMLEE